MISFKTNTLEIGAQLSYIEKLSIINLMRFEVISKSIN
jgi:hypothetical protein